MYRPTPYEVSLEHPPPTGYPVPMLTRLRNRVAARHLLWKSRRAYVTESDSGPILVLPGVLDPVATKVGAWLGETMRGVVSPGEHWIDMGCGTGVVGLAMARAGARVTCADIDDACVANARANAALRRLDLDARVSDLFGALDPADGVVYNAPFWPGEGAGEPFGRAMYAGKAFEAIQRYRAEADASGVQRVLLALSEAGRDHAGARAAFGRHRLTHRARVGAEWLVLIEAE